ncbi:hypothetical protein NCCP2140_14870 [Pseudoalteromonas sp. NCCP-2140]|nr:hypothetical protein NCCP2140_14870 [Pseudoalteromonas sp. NCCP-2140]
MESLTKPLMKYETIIIKDKTRTRLSVLLILIAKLNKKAIKKPHSMKAPNKSPKKASIYII